MNFRWLRPLKRRIFARPIGRLMDEIDELHNAIWREQQLCAPLGHASEHPQRPPLESLRELALHRYNLKPTATRLRLHRVGKRLAGILVVVEYPACADVLHLAIHPDLQGQGHGRQMMQSVMNEIRAKGVPLLVLECPLSNERGLGFFRALQPEREEPGANGAQTFTFRLLEDGAALQPSVQETLEELDALHDAVWAEQRNYGPLGGSEDRPERPNPEWLRKVVQGRAADSRMPTRITLLREAARLIGYLIVEDASPNLRVLHLVVHPDQQGRGHGRRLMDQAMAEAKQRKMDGLELECYHFNTQGLGFYRALSPTPEERIDERWVTFRYPLSPGPGSI